MATPKKKVTRKRLKTLVIKESKWLRFGSPVFSVLYSSGGLPGSGVSKGHMCCLGFLAKACGAEARQIKGKASPEFALNVKWPKNVVLKDGSETAWTEKAININDMDNYETLEEREAALKKHFVKIGFKLVFVP